MLDLLEIYGIQMSEEMTGLLKLLDENYLKVTFSDEEYSEMINELKDFLEEQS